jgi:peptide/nickel transport system ATP-binding protein
MGRSLGGRGLGFFFGCLRQRDVVDTLRRIFNFFKQSELGGDRMIRQDVLEVKDLATTFSTDAGLVAAVQGVSLRIQKGKTLGVVGESGCGKSVTSLSIMGLLPKSVGKISSGAILFEGKDLAKLSESEMQKIRGNRIAMIFQEPMTALNPVFTAGEQVMEVFETHRGMNRAQAREAALTMLNKVRIPDPERRLDEYPHQMSGGMKQRIMIAMALACEPALIIADEPTTALDVTIQAQILRLMQELQRETGTAILFITHDLSVIAEVADHVVVMYAGQVIESADVMTLFDAAAHPYTQGLLNSIPKHGQTKAIPLQAIPGVVPSLRKRPVGCSFQERCSLRQEECSKAAPQLKPLSDGHSVACFVATRKAEKSAPRRDA